MVRAQVHSVKHYVQHSLTTTVAGAVTSVLLVNAKEVSGVVSVSDVREGSTVKAVWLELWIRSPEASPGSFVFTIEKQPGGITVNPSAVNMAALGDYTNKKNILYTSQALTNDNSADAIVVYKGWIRIPKSKQRFGLDDNLIFTVFAQALDNVTCGFVTFKEYF